VEVFLLLLPPLSLSLSQMEFFFFFLIDLLTVLGQNLWWIDILQSLVKENVIIK
jgi:hypothetical protein